MIENSIIVDNLPSTEDFYLIKIQNSRNSKIVEVFLERLREFSLFPLPCYFLSSKNVLVCLSNLWLVAYLSKSDVVWEGGWRWKSVELWPCSAWVIRGLPDAPRHQGGVGGVDGTVQDRHGQRKQLVTSGRIVIWRILQSVMKIP